MSRMSNEPPQPSPLGEAVEGVVELAKWFTTLVRDQAGDVAHKVETADAAGETDGGFGVTGATGALARWAALPLLGWAGLMNEVVDAAAVLTRRLGRAGYIASEDFRAEPAEGQRVLKLGGEPLKNGFGDELIATSVAIVPNLLEPGEFTFRLEAKEVSPESVGVYRGTVTVSDAHSTTDPPDVVDVWIVVPAPTHARDL